jgi:hypothetical protein
LRQRRIKAVVKKEVKELIRDPISLITLFLVPVSMMVVFGFLKLKQIKEKLVISQKKKEITT